MSQPATNARVSNRGQTSLPANLRRRWGIEEGGEVGVLDLGHAALIIPGGVESARLELLRTLETTYDDGLDQLDDPDLQDH